MNKKLASSLFFFTATILLLFSASIARAQEDSDPKCGCASPATERGTMGGESRMPVM